MKRIELDLKLVTPAFLGGPNPGGPAEWRAASVRGQLRWWFRALAGGRLGGDLAAVNAAETAVFGSTERSSALLLRASGGVSSNDAAVFGATKTARDLSEAWGDASSSTERRLLLERRDETTGKKWQIDSNPLHYLGYGPFDKGKLLRSYLPQRSELHLQLTLRRALGTVSGLELEPLLARALWAWIHLGGIGARSRRGYGSLALTSPKPKLDGWPGLPADRAGFVACVAEALALGAAPAASRPEWTYLSSAARVALPGSGSGSWKDAMNLAGGWLMAFRRRYGRSGDVRTTGTVADRDYAWVKGSTKPAQVPDRAGFGLPLGFTKDKARVSPLPRGRFSAGDVAIRPDEGRRASPLLLHIAELSGRFYPVLTYLPALLVPAGKDLALLRQTDPQDKTLWRVDAVSPATNEQGAVVAAFLDDLTTKKLVETVWP